MKGLAYLLLTGYLAVATLFPNSVLARNGGGEPTCSTAIAEADTSSLPGEQCPIWVFFNTYYNFCDPTTIYMEAVPGGGTGPYTYQWENGDTGQLILIPFVVELFYYVTVTDATGCVEVDFTHIKPVPPGPTFPFNNENCDGNTVTLFLDWIRDSFPGNTYLWSTGATTPTIDITTSGVYTVTVTSADGCEYVYPIDYTFHPTPEPEIVGPTSLCPGNSATLSVTGGNFELIYWFPPELYQPTLTVTEPGTYVAYAWYPDVGFCPGADTIVIVPDDIPPPELTGAATLCTGQSGTVIVSNSSEYTGFYGTTERPRPPFPSRRAAPTA